MEEKIDTKNKQGFFSDYITSKLDLPDTDIRTYSPLTLAYIGDVIFDLLVRTMVVKRGNEPVNNLHNKTTKIIQASNQADMYFAIKDKLTEEELAVFKRGRNAKSHSVAKNASIADYKIATGLEALVGYLYLTDQMDRIIELIKEEII